MVTTHVWFESSSTAAALPRFLAAKQALRRAMAPVAKASAMGLPDIVSIYFSETEESPAVLGESDCD